MIKPLPTLIMPVLPVQVIVSQGTLGEEMFLLKSGTVKVSVFDPETEKEVTLRFQSAGTCFGEGSLWMEKARRTTTVTSVDFCQLYVLTGRDLEETLVKFPEFKPVIATNAISMTLRNRVLCPGLCGGDMSNHPRLVHRAVLCCSHRACVWSLFTLSIANEWCLLPRDEIEDGWLTRCKPDAYSPKRQAYPGTARTISLGTCPRKRSSLAMEKFSAKVPPPPKPRRPSNP